METFLSNVDLLILYGIIIFMTLILALRETFRFRMLNSRFTQLSIFIPLISLGTMLLILGVIFIHHGWMKLIWGVIEYFIFAAIFYHLLKKLFLNDLKEFSASLELFYNNPNNQTIISEKSIDKVFFMDLAVRLHRSGNTKAISMLKDPSNLYEVIKIYTESPDNWTEEDKFITTSNFLEYGILN